MRQSELFTKVGRDFPKDEVAVNAKLLARAGFIYKNSAGVYSYLPLGWRVVGKIAGIVRDEMNAIGGQEMFMPALVEKKYLEASGRSEVPISFEVKERGGEKARFVLGWTHEEVLAAIAKKYISSYKDLPFSAYQIQTKFRNEPRAKSGLLRGREFIMKDLYSFHATESDFRSYYETVAASYHKIFSRCGLSALRTIATGGAFTSAHTDEFQVLAGSGEDTILLCKICSYAENKEISKLKVGDQCPECRGEVKEEKAIEVGNIFPLGTKYSKAFDLHFLDQDGITKEVFMGSYGIGLGRLMAAIVEIHHDKSGIIWPETVTPFPAHLLELEGASAEAHSHALQKEGLEVLYDDRPLSAGEKFAEADLIGISWRLVMSPKTGDKVEVKKRDEKKAEVMSISNLIKKLKIQG